MADVSPCPDGPKEGADLLNQDLWDVECWVVSSAVRHVEVLQVESPANGLRRRRFVRDTARKSEHTCRNLYPFSRSQDPIAVEHLVVQPVGGRDGFGEPVDRQDRQHLVEREGAPELSVAVGPRSKLLDDP